MKEIGIIHIAVVHQKYNVKNYHIVQILLLHKKQFSLLVRSIPLDVHMVRKLSYLLVRTAQYNLNKILGLNFIIEQVYFVNIK